MNNIFSFEQISRTGYLDANLIVRQHKLDIVARFTKIESVNPNLEQNEIGK